LSTAMPMASRPRNDLLARRTRAWILCSFSSGGGQQFAAFTRPLIGEQRIATDDEPLARIIERGDLSQIAIVEQRELQFAGVDELAGGRRA
jgi:hypothetical protein